MDSRVLSRGVATPTTELTTSLDSMLRHPTDSPQWNMINEDFFEFESDARNLWLDLSTDEMNSYGNMSSTHSTRPVMLTIYNPPPWLCMKRKFLMVSLLISEPRQPRNDIDIYLAPITKDLKIMWEERAEVFDAYRQELFILRAILLWAINDFPTYELVGVQCKRTQSMSYMWRRHICWPKVTITLV